MSPACELVLFSGAFATEMLWNPYSFLQELSFKHITINLQFINTKKENQLLNSKNMYEILELTTRLYPFEGSLPKQAVITTTVSFLIANLSSPTPTSTSTSEQQTTLSRQLLCSKRLETRKGCFPINHSIEMICEVSCLFKRIFYFRLSQMSKGLLKLYHHPGEGKDSREEILNQRDNLGLFIRLT